MVNLSKMLSQHYLGTATREFYKKERAHINEFEVDEAGRKERIKSANRDEARENLFCRVLPTLAEVGLASYFVYEGNARKALICVGLVELGRAVVSSVYRWGVREWRKDEMKLETRDTVVQDLVNNYRPHKPKGR